MGPGDMTEVMPPHALTVHTLGHGTRAIEAFLEVVRGHRLRCVVDVRRFPGSNRHPQFSREALAEALRLAGVEYVWEGEALGGRRSPSDHSRHSAIRSASFRAYADHMATEAFRLGLDRLLKHASASPTGILCAETLPWRCHRFFIADALVARGARVLHALSPGRSDEHRLHPMARIEGSMLVYDGRASGESLLFPEAT
jgi:uncharacterized protein (DUF488 family)